MQEERDAGLDKDFAKLGGAAFLDRLKKDHKAYGEALGITDATQKPTETAVVREPHLAARKALRSFVLLASAHADENPDEQFLVERLLRPIADWQGTTTKPVAAAPVAPVPAPAPAPTQGETITA